MSSDANFTGATLVTYDWRQTELAHRVERVGSNEPEGADKHTRVGATTADHHEQESSREKREAEHHLERGRRLTLGAAEARPHPCENWREDDDDERIHRLEPTRWNVE